MYLVKTDATGALEWSKLYGGTLIEQAHSVKQTSDGGYLLAGESQSFAGSAEFYVVKTDPNGDCGCNEQSPPTIVTSPATTVATLSGPGLWGSGGSRRNAGTVVTSPASAENVVCFTSVLPIELLSFTAESIENNTIQLNWLTAAETNNDYFTVERSQGGLNFSTVGIVTGAGNSNTTSSYSFIDQQPHPGINYYRLKQIDFDGKHTYSNTISVLPGVAETLPVVQQMAEYLLISIDDKGQSEISAYTIMGRQVYQNQLQGDFKHKVSLSHLESGIYFLNIKIGSQNYQQKFVIN